MILTQAQREERYRRQRVRAASQARVNGHEKAIAKAVGLTPRGLAYLCRIAAQSPIRAARKSGTEHMPLLAKGLIEETVNSLSNGGGWGMRYTLTEAGKAIVAKARELGF